MSGLCAYTIAAYFTLCCIFAYFSKVCILHIFLLKLAFLAAICFAIYFDHLVANRMALSMCPDPCGTGWGSWFQAILYNISIYFSRIFAVYPVHIFF